MRTRIVRDLVLAAALCAALVPEANGQAPLLGIGLTIGYVALSVSAIARLSERVPARPARTGDSLRVNVRGAGGTFEYVGRATVIRRDSVTLQATDSAVTFALADPISIRSYAGERSSWPEGWAVGFSGGLLIGGIAGYAAGGTPSSCEIFCPTRSQGVLILGVAGAVTGSVILAGIGALGHTTKWQSVNRLVTSDDTPRVSFAPILGHQSGMLLRVAF